MQGDLVDEANWENLGPADSTMQDVAQEQQGALSNAMLTDRPGRPVVPYYLQHQTAALNQYQRLISHPRYPHFQEAQVLRNKWWE